MIMPEDLQCLKVIALAGGCRGPVWVSSQSLGSELSISPQTASRRLQSLERQMLVRRDINPDGQQITITSAGEEELRREYSDYCRVFDRENAHYVLRGHVITGLGEGRYYMSLEPYQRQFRKRLGFSPYPGTLNIRLDQSSIQIRKRLDLLEWTRISGFSADERTFGDVRCLPCRISDHPCGIVVPGRSHYPEDIIELVAPVSLRAALGLSDNDEVKVEVAYD
ncbi:MAG: riboflavin kinase [Methanolinea sp. SDB]|nr:MAG: riboflavin kinase [Methanolinea sp. SDB]